MRQQLTLKLVILVLLLIFFANPVNAAYNSFFAKDNFILKAIKVEDVNDPNLITDITVFQNSKAEKFIIDNGVVQVFLQSGSIFKVGAASSSVASMLYYNTNEEYCINNTNPGATTTDIFGYGSSSYYLKFKTTACAASSTPPPNVIVDEIYDPSLGATTTTIIQGDTEIKTIETATSTTDGTTKRKELTTTKVGSIVSEVSLKTTISPASTPINTQTINLIIEGESVRELIIDLPPAFMQDFGANKDVVVDVYYKAASYSQTSTGKIIVDSKVFPIDINVSGTSVKTFSTPTSLTFVIENIIDRDNLVIAWFDTSTNTWTNLVSTISGDRIAASVAHLTDFALAIDDTQNTPTPTKSSGGGGGSYTPFVEEDKNIKKTQSYKVSSDGTEVKGEIISMANSSGAITKTSIEAIITPSTNIKDAQTINLDTSVRSSIKEIKLNLTKDILQELVGTSSQPKKINIDISNQQATEKQKTSKARSGMFLVGFDVFSVDISAYGNKVKTFTNPLSMSFDISEVRRDKENLKVYYFDELSGVWKQAGDGGKIVGNELIINIDHLTDFALMDVATIKTTEKIEAKDIFVTILDDLQLNQILTDASIVFESGTNLDAIIEYNSAIKDVDAQRNGIDTYTMPMVRDDANLTTSQIYAINNFIVYGTKSTQILGAGERAGVVSSYKKAFDKLPMTQKEWEDVVKISNGRWPNERSELAEDKANKEFIKIYKRSANMDNSNDNAAVTVMAYGLRPTQRNMDSEKAAIKSFKNIYKYSPKSALDWDIARAIAYSGATRGVKNITVEIKDVSVGSKACAADIKFSEYLVYRTVSSQVSELQKLLQCLGYFSKDNKITTYFGNITRGAVKDFQKDNKINQTGTVGPFTRSVLNKY